MALMICSLLPPSRAVAHGSGGDPDQKNVVKSYPIEAVFESENSLYFVCFDHGVENIANGERFPSGSTQIIRQSQDAAEIIGRMTPFGGEPSIVKVEPTNHRADVKGSLHRVELPIGAWDAGPVSQQSARNNGPQMLCAFRKTQG